MEFWIVWCIGIAITIVTKIVIDKLTRKLKDDDYYSTISRNSIYEKNKKARVLVHILVIICINIVGGIIVAKFIGMFLPTYMQGERTEINIIMDSIPIIISIVLTYVVGYWILGLHRLDEKLEKVWVIAFLISIICWLIPIYQYNNNIETVQKTSMERQEQRQLTHFCNIPVQEVTGTITGSRYSITEEITTSDTLPYWYLNEAGEGIYDSALADKSKIVFVEEGPFYVEISYNNTKTIWVNHNNGKEKIENEEKWEEYIFYLPRTIMQYNLN